MKWGESLISLKKKKKKNLVLFTFLLFFFIKMGDLQSTVDDFKELHGTFSVGSCRSCSPRLYLAEVNRSAFL